MTTESKDKVDALIQDKTSLQQSVHHNQKLKTGVCGHYQRICLQNSHHQIQSSLRKIHTEIKSFCPHEGCTGCSFVADITLKCSMHEELQPFSKEFYVIGIQHLMQRLKKSP
jgi:hypothetical protein